MEHCISRMNTILGKYAQYDPNIEEDVPLLFVVGIPRSGTTLLSQVMAAYFEIGFIDKLAARFWSDPITGIHFSRHVGAEVDRVSKFESWHGKAAGIMGPHEFSYFWNHWLKCSPCEPYDIKKTKQTIDWAMLRTILINISREFQSGLMMKALLTGYHLEHFSHLFNKAVFVYIKRDLVDICISLRDARIAHYQDPNRWWSMYPDPEYFEHIKDMDYRQQIPHQVYYLSEMLNKAAPRAETMTIEYADLCNNPKLEMNILSDYVKCSTGIRLTSNDTIPNSFAISHKEVDPDYMIFQSELEKLREQGE